MRRDAVIFDLFGTLVPPFGESQHSELIQEMSVLLGVPPAAFEESWRSAYEARRVGRATVGDQVREICRLLLGDEVSAARVDQALDLRMRFFRRSLVPRSNAIIVLEKVRDDGLKLGLVSDTSSETCVVWPTTPFVALMDVAVFSCEVGCHKPDPRIYRAAWEALGVDPTRCLYVGDGMSQELTGARRVGMDAVLLRVEGEHDPQAEIEQWEGTTIASLDEVLPLVLD